MNVITVIVKTILEIPTIIVKTTCKTPKVIVETSTSGGGCLGIIVGLVIIIALLVSAIRGCNYAVETYIIKGLNPAFKTSFEIAKEKKLEQEREKIENEKKRKNIEKLLAKKMGLKTTHDWYHEPEIFFVNDREILAIVTIRHGEPNLIRTEDSGDSWKTILAGTENRYFGRLSVKKTEGGEKIITIFLNMTGALIAQSKNDGKTWEYIDQSGRRATPIIKNGKIAVYP